MEEALARAIKTRLKDEVGQYLAELERRAPGMILPDFYVVALGESYQFDGLPAMRIIPQGWSKVSDQITWSECEDITLSYRYQIDVFLEGDDPEEIELRMMRYREAVLECLEADYTLGGLAHGSIVGSVGNYNLMAGAQSRLELGTRLEYEVLAPATAGDRRFFELS